MDKEASRQIAQANQAVENSVIEGKVEPVLVLDAPLGTVVQLRSGGPLMTIVAKKDGGIDQCQYYSEPMGDFMTEDFHEDYLIAWWNPSIEQTVNSLLKIRETDKRWRTNSRN